MDAGCQFGWARSLFGYISERAYREFCFILQRPLDCCASDSWKMWYSLVFIKKCGFAYVCWNVAHTDYLYSIDSHQQIRQHLCPLRWPTFCFETSSSCYWKCWFCCRSPLHLSKLDFGCWLYCWKTSSAKVIFVFICLQVETHIALYWCYLALHIDFVWTS